MRTLSRLLIVGLVSCLSPFIAAAQMPATSGGPGKVDRDAFKDVKFSDGLMQEAMSQKLALGGNNKLQNGAQRKAYGFYLDALVTSINPDARVGGQSVADQLLVQVRDLVSPGHEPNAGAGLNGWTHHAIAQAFLLVKKTPEVWGKLTDDEKNRMDWIMKAMAVAGSFQFDDGNDYHTSLHADDNTQKGWNPNHRLYLFVVLAAADYFGPKELNEIYTSFNYDEYIKKFDELGFSNIKAVWTCYDWKPIMEKGGPYISPKKKAENGTGTGVTHPFTYNKIPLENIAEIYCAVAGFNYSKTVTNGEEGKSWILNNGVSPFLGQPGMMLEFESHDAEGIRSDLDYCNEDFCSYTTMMMTLRVLGLWPPTDATRNMDKLMYVGNEDFLYKNATGFHSFSHAKGRDSGKLEAGKSAFPMIQEMWNGYLKGKLKP